MLYTFTRFEFDFFFLKVGEKKIDVRQKTFDVYVYAYVFSLDVRRFIFFHYSIRISKKKNSRRRFTCGLLIKYYTDIYIFFFLRS